MSSNLHHVFEGGNTMRLQLAKLPAWLLAVAGSLFCLAERSGAQQPKEAKPEVGKSSYDQIAPVLTGQETFEQMKTRDKAQKAAIMARQKALLETRYDLSKKFDPKVTLFRGKSLPVGPTAKLPKGVTWEALAKMTPEEMKEKGPVP